MQGQHFSSCLIFMKFPCNLRRFNGPPFNSLQTSYLLSGSFNNYVDKRRLIGGPGNGTQIFSYNIKEIHSQMSTRGRSDMIGGQEVAKFGQRSL